MKYKQLLDLATTPGNDLLIFENGNGLITGPKYVQGIWISSAIIKVWKEEGFI